MRLPGIPSYQLFSFAKSRHHCTPFYPNVLGSSRAFGARVEVCSKQPKPFCCFGDAYHPAPPAHGTKSEEHVLQLIMESSTGGIRHIFAEHNGRNLRSRADFAAFCFSLDATTAPSRICSTVLATATIQLLIPAAAEYFSPLSVIQAASAGHTAPPPVWQAHAESGMRRPPGHK